MNLKSEQRRLYGLLSPSARCFVRVCDDDSALWVSDFPRRCETSAGVLELLRGQGFCVRAEEAAGVWYIDWTMERWQAEIEGLPTVCPAFPAQESLHEAYALCRQLMHHPAPLKKEHLPSVRRVLKRTAEPPVRMKGVIRPLYEEAARLLREQKDVPHAAGRILAAWLNEQNH